MTDHHKLIENGDDTARRLAALDIAIDRTGLRIEPLDGSRPFVQPESVPPLIALAEWILTGPSQDVHGEVLSFEPQAGEFVVGTVELPSGTDPQDLARRIVDAAFGRGPYADGATREPLPPPFRPALEVLATAAHELAVAHGVARISTLGTDDYAAAHRRTLTGVTESFHEWTTFDHAIEQAYNALGWARHPEGDTHD